MFLHQMKIFFHIHSNNKTLNLIIFSNSLFLSDERRDATRPKKRFKAADIMKMHDILSKNMYKIRQKVNEQLFMKTSQDQRQKWHI